MTTSRLLRPVVLVASVGCVTAAGGLAVPPPASQLIVDVTLIDGTGAAPRPGTSVLVRGGRIVAIGPRAHLRAAGATVIDGRKGFLLPGFVDAHAHLPFGPVELTGGRMQFRYDEAASHTMARQLLAFGVTTVRNPAVHIAEVEKLRMAVRAGRTLAPRIVSSGPVIDYAPSALSAAVKSPDEARAEVRRQVAAGARFIKLYNWMSAPAVAAAIDEAHRLGVPATGHLMMTNWREAAESGIDALEHITPLSPSLIEPGQRQEFSQRMLAAPTGFMLEWFNYASFDGPLLAETVRQLAERRVIVTPTLVTFAAMAKARDPVLKEGQDALAIPAVLRDSYASSDFTVGWDAPQFARVRRAWPRVQEWVRRLHAAGVPLAVGSDTPMPWVPAGASLHEEMRLLVEAGVPAMDVLVAATRTGARLARVDSIVGSVEVGKVADLVLLDADPTRDIRNTRRIRWVMTGGVLRPSAASSRPVADAAEPDAEKSVRRLLERLLEAVRAQDGAKMASVYVLEPPIEFSSHGMLMASRDSLLTFYAGWDPAQSRGTFAEFQDVRIRHLGPRAVLVHARLRLARGGPDGTASDTMSGGWTGLFECRAGRWGLSHEHESFTLTGRRP